MLNEKGYEIPDSTPVEIPSRLRMPVSRSAQIRAMIRNEMSRAAADQGQETFEEADDFELPDGEPWISPYENDFDPPLESGLQGGGLEEGGGTPTGDPVKPGEGVQPPAKPDPADGDAQPSQ